MSSSRSNNPDVRLALCKAIDKENLINEIYQGFAYPAWGILPKGFPNYNEANRDLDPNVFDVDAAKELLAGAGYADGAGFPSYEIWIRQPSTQQSAVCQAIQARWKENLGITVELRPSDFQSFTNAAFTEKTAPIYYVNYAQDYNDPATFLNVFRSTGRHPHADESWDELYDAANSSFDEEARMSGMAEAESLLVKSCAWFFMAQPFSTSLWHCNAGGWGLEPNKDGYQFLGRRRHGLPARLRRYLLEGFRLPQRPLGAWPETSGARAGGRSATSRGGFWSPGGSARPSRSRFWLWVGRQRRLPARRLPFRPGF